MENSSLLQHLQEASARIGKTWPLYSFVTSNPLSGYEEQPFRKALQQAGGLTGARVFPGVEQFRKAWQQGEIQSEILVPLLREHGLEEDPEAGLKQMTNSNSPTKSVAERTLDRLTTKWVTAFLDEGLAEWPMPRKEEGFYKAWRNLARYDDQLPGLKEIQLPATAREALLSVLGGVPEEERTEVMVCHLAALPGWTGYIKYREEAQTPWQNAYPITLEDYLAVRLIIARTIGAPILPQGTCRGERDPELTLKYVWLTAWERSWQKNLLGTLSSAPTGRDEDAAKRIPDAQMVFCIDTRSEPIRRHIECQGAYETYGYAGFFGIAMDYEHPKDGLVRKSCPPILDSAYKVREVPRDTKADQFEEYLNTRVRYNFVQYFLRRMKNMLPSAFGYVEGTGIYYGGLILARTWLPGGVYRVLQKWAPKHESICEPDIRPMQGDEPADASLGIALDEKVAIVKSAFDLMGWKEFAPLVIFTGHGSHTANNPFASSLDCGACAASPGRQNARMLAKLANQKAVRQKLIRDFGLIIPESTHFMGAEHNTTTDEITLFDSDVPSTHRGLLEKVRADLVRARASAVRERLDLGAEDVLAAERKAGDWAETRPEWGLAKNAGFVIGPRSLTEKSNLGGRCFLHSYQWEADPEGKALEGIMQGPMVVTQWINNHYYFATVDPHRFGGGDKITHNVTGRFGVLQGNGGDLKSGLPLQSLYQSDAEGYHQPLRLSVCIEAPKERVGEILSRNPHLKNLLDNQWIYLSVLDPQQSVVYHYTKGLSWQVAELDAEHTGVTSPREVSAGTLIEA